MIQNIVKATNNLDFKNIDKIKEIIDEKYDINHKDKCMIHKL